MNSIIEIVPFASEHRQSVINLLMSSFFIQEPLNAVLKFDIPREPLLWVDSIVDGALRDQCSFVAIDTDTPCKEVVGVILNGISQRSAHEELETYPSEKLTLIFSIIEKVSEKHNLFAKI